MKIILHSELNLKPVKYAIKTIFKDFLGIEYTIEIYDKNERIVTEDLTLYYGPKGEADLEFDFIIYSSNLWKKEFYLKGESLPFVPLERYNDPVLNDYIGESSIPIIYKSIDYSNEEPFVKKNSQNNYYTNIDFFASIFYMLTGYEEAINKFEDMHRRYPGQKSLAFNENFLERPIVNEYVEILWLFISKINSNLRKKKRKFELLITHDVDQIKVGNLRHRLRILISQLYSKKSLKGFLIKLGQFFRWLFTFPKDSFKYIMRISKKYNFKSHFFFLVTGSGESFDRKRYNIHSKEIINLISKLEAEGHKIGLHSSYNSFLNKEQILKEKAILDKYVKNKKYGLRCHYLRFKIPESYTLLNDCGFQYDSTVYYADNDGFRAGTCYPFHPYDLYNDKELEILEYPLIVMEGTLINPTYRNMTSKQEVVALLKRRIDKIKFFNGYFVFLIHNHSFENLAFPWRSVFRKMLKYSTKKN